MSETDVDDELVKNFKDGLRIDSGENTIQDLKVLPNLGELECPFTWTFDHKCDVRDIVDKVEEKLEEMDDEDEELISWKSFVLNLILCYEYAKNGDLEDAEEKLTILDAILDEKNDCEYSGPVMGLGLRHITLACKCFLLRASQLFNEIDHYFSAIVPFQDLENKEKASVFCMKGAYFAEFGYGGIKVSVGEFEKALEIDDECGEWYFLLGRSLSRLRRMEKRSAIPDKRELKFLERAVELSNFVSFMVLLAQSYRETARNLTIEKRKELRSFKPYCDSLNNKSWELYKRVLGRNKINVHVLIRCGLGLMKLPKPWKDLDSAKMCILKALDIAPKNPMANHVAGTYYSTVGNHKQAMEYLSKACAFGVFGAEIDLIVLKSKQFETYDPVADIERLLDVYKEKPHQESALCFLGAYYHFSKNNFKKAFEYWSQVIEMDINSEKLKVCYPLGVGHPVNINKIIVPEIMKLLSSREVIDSERTLYDRTITEYIKQHPGLVISVTDIDVSLYKDKKFEYRSWKNRSVRDIRFSEKSGPSQSLSSNEPLSSRPQCSTSSRSESSFFNVAIQSCGVPSASSDGATDCRSAKSSSRGKEPRGSRGGRGRGRGRSDGAEGGNKNRNGEKRGQLSWRGRGARSGTCKGNTCVGKKIINQDAE